MEGSSVLVRSEGKEGRKEGEEEKMRRWFRKGGGDFEGWECCGRVWMLI
jgi:hypothetical protein